MSSVSLAEVIRAGVSAALDELHTAMPARVVSYDPATNTITAEPGLKQGVFVAGKRTYETLPNIPAVPVIWPRAGGVVLTLPLEPGDWVWLMFSESSLAEWKRQGSVSQPEDARRHSIGYPVAIPGAFPSVATLSAEDLAERVAGATVFGEDGGTAQMLLGGTVPGFRFGKAAVHPVALAPPVVASLSAVATALTKVQAVLSALVSVPANSGASGAATASGNAVTAAVNAADDAATAAPSTLVKSQ